MANKFRVGSTCSTQIFINFFYLVGEILLVNLETFTVSDSLLLANTSWSRRILKQSPPDVIFISRATIISFVQSKKGAIADCSRAIGCSSKHQKGQPTV